MQSCPEKKLNRITSPPSVATEFVVSGRIKQGEFNPSLYATRTGRVLSILDNGGSEFRADLHLPRVEKASDGGHLLFDHTHVKCMLADGTFLDCKGFLDVNEGVVVMDAADKYGSKYIWFWLKVDCFVLSASEAGKGSGLFNPEKFASAAALDVLYEYVKKAMSAPLPFHVPMPIAREELDGDSRFCALSVLHQANVLSSDIVCRINYKMEHGESLLRVLFPSGGVEGGQVSDVDVKRQILAIQEEFYPTIREEWGAQAKTLFEWSQAAFHGPARN